MFIKKVDTLLNILICLDHLRTMRFIFKEIQLHAVFSADSFYLFCHVDRLMIVDDQVICSMLNQHWRTTFLYMTDRAYLTCTFRIIQWIISQQHRKH